MMWNWISLSGAIAMTAAGHVEYKVYFFARKRKHLLFAAICFLVAVICSYIALRHLKVGTVYMSTAATQGIVLVLSRYLLKETVSKGQFLAVLTIVVGILIYNV